MSEPQTLEEAWEGLDTQVLELLRFDKNLTSDHIRDAKNAARALAFAVLAEAANEEGNPFPLEGEGYAKLQRRIEALGK